MSIRIQTKTMKRLKVLNEYDEVIIADYLKDILTGFGVREVCLAHSKKDAIKLLHEIKPDVALLDIRMEKELDGLELGDYINANFQIPFIYITAHSDMAMIKKIVKTMPAAYITKPFKKSDLFASLNLAAAEMEQSRNSSLHIKDGYETVIIPFNNIHYIEGEGNYINIFCEDKKVVSRQSLDSVMGQLDNEIFFRIHRSYIINILKVFRYSKKDVELNGNTLPVSRNIADQFETVMTNRIKI